MNKQGKQFIQDMLLLHKRHHYSQSRGLVTYKWTQLFSARNPDNSPKAQASFPYILPSPIAWAITVTSLNDITIICATFSMGKLLCMCRGNAIICLHICQHSCYNPQLLQLHPNLDVFSLTQISCLWHIYETKEYRKLIFICFWKSVRSHEVSLKWAIIWVQILILGQWKKICCPRNCFIKFNRKN